MPSNVSEVQVVDPKYARGVLAEEVRFRRDRRQQIFSWASSLLVAIIGGSTALASKTQLQLAPVQRLGLYVAIAIVGIYSAFWLSYHYYRERHFRAACEEYDKEIGLPPSLRMHTSWSLDWTNILALVGLTAAAVVAVIYNLGP
jgi:hypothetical protein